VKVDLQVVMNVDPVVRRVNVARQVDLGKFQAAIVEDYQVAGRHAQVYRDPSTRPATFPEQSSAHRLRKRRLPPSAVENTRGKESPVNQYSTLKFDTIEQVGVRQVVVAATHCREADAPEPVCQV
jgi:hypothetical protein